MAYRLLQADAKRLFLFFLHVDEEQRGAKLVRADNFSVTGAVGGFASPRAAFSHHPTGSCEGKAKE